MQLKKPIKNALRKAREQYEAGHHENAAEQYEKASKLMEVFADQAFSRDAELKRKKKSVRYRETARKLRSGELSPENEVDPDQTPSDEEPATATGSEEIRNAVHQLIHHADVTWDDIGGLEDTKREIKYTLGVTLARTPEDVDIESWDKMLFYGPPGTGKTLLAAATSNAVRSSEGVPSVFFNVKLSAVLSKYFGESSQIVSELYGMARDTSPAVIFMDEIESITSHRETADTGAERRLLSTILSELDGLEEKGKEDLYVLTIAATNRPWDLDPAVLSRFEKKIFIPLPDRKARKEILKIHLTNRGIESEIPMEKIAEITDGMSGREIEQFGKQAISLMISDENDTLPDLVDEGLDRVQSYELQTRPLTIDDFKQAAAEITPQTTRDEQERYQEWRSSIER